MPCRIEEKEGEGVRLTFRLWCEWYPQWKKEERKTLGSAKLIGLPEPELPSIEPCIQRIIRDYQAQCLPLAGKAQTQLKQLSTQGEASGLSDLHAGSCSTSSKQQCVGLKQSLQGCRGIILLSGSGSAK